MSGNLRSTQKTNNNGDDDISAIDEVDEDTDRHDNEIVSPPKSPPTESRRGSFNVGAHLLSTTKSKASQDDPQVEMIKMLKQIDEKHKKQMEELKS